MTQVTNTNGAVSVIIPIIAIPLFSIEESMIAKEIQRKSRQFFPVSAMAQSMAL